MSKTLAGMISRYYRDPVLFVNEVFDKAPEDFKGPDEWQKDFMNDVVKHSRVCSIACKGPGKSAALSWIGWWWLATRFCSQIAATSITADNLKGGLWKEFSLWHSRSSLLQRMFTWTKSEIMVNHPEHRGHWKAEARTWAKDADSTQQAHALAGLHGDYFMFLMDEAGGYPDAILATAEAILASGKECKIVMVGNPTHCEGPLYAATTTRKHLWETTHITGDPDDPKRSPRISKKWAQEQIDQFGRDDPWVLVNVFGRFPPTSLNALLGPDEIRAAMTRIPDEEDYRFSQKRFGIDVARFGDDATVIFPRQGLWAGDCTLLRGARTEHIVGQVLYKKREWGAEVEMVDGTGGFGAGVVDGLRQAGGSPLEVHFSSRPMNEKYFNKRAEMWIELRDWVRRGGRLPNDSQLARELSSVQYAVTSTGKLKIEDKEAVKKRLGFSPDRGDALALTFALPEISGNQTASGIYLGKQKIETTWNPLDRSRW